MTQPDPSTPISDEAVEAARAAYGHSWSVDGRRRRWLDGKGNVRESWAEGFFWVWTEEVAETEHRAMRAALSAAAPFMEGERHGVVFGEGPDGIFSVCVDGDMYAPMAELDAAEAEAATLAAQIEAVREAVADMPTCEHTPLNSARRYWCSTFSSYAPCFGEEMAAALAEKVCSR